MSGLINIIFKSIPEGITTDNIRFYHTLNFIYPAAIAIHVSFFCIFLALDVMPLVYFNVGSVLLFISAMFLNRRGFHVLSLALAILEVVCHAGVCVHFFGWSAGFQHYAFVVAMLPFLAPRGNNIVKLLECTVITLLYMGMYFYAHSHEAPRPLSPLLDTIFNYSVIGTTFALICGTAFYFSYIAEQRMDEVTSLKVQQDGDYLLTSLLIKPLIGNYNTSKNINAEIFVRQYKRFSFRKMNSELGGDLCVVDDIELKERKYTVYINADAMGKSMQGAGGALVLGTVFKSFVSRSKNSSNAKALTPQRWMAQLFREIHNVFVTFDGAMLVSAVFGLLDDETGLLYYINAEHPEPVIYRGGQAHFIQQELYIPKLGTDLPNKKLSVFSYQMEAGDILILGSDGRDDILVGHDSESRRQINHNPERFLKIVERGQGRLDTIVEEISKSGELTDDLSLLKLVYKG